MQNRCPHCHIVAGGVLKGYRWIISARGYANIVKSSSDTVHGVVYRLSGPDEQRLDEYEGVSGGSYRKELLHVEIHGAPARCLVYVDPIEEEGVPRKEYSDRINKGIKDAQLPADYVQNFIRKFVPGSTADGLNLDHQ